MILLLLIKLASAAPFLPFYSFLQVCFIVRYFHLLVFTIVRAWHSFSLTFISTRRFKPVFSHLVLSLSLRRLFHAPPDNPEVSICHLAST